MIGAITSCLPTSKCCFLKFEGSDRDYFAEHDPPDNTNYFIRSTYLKNLSDAKVSRKSVTTVDGQNPAPSKTIKRRKNGIINQPQPVSSISEAFYGYQHLNIHRRMPPSDCNHAGGVAIDSTTHLIAAFFCFTAMLELFVYPPGN